MALAARDWDPARYGAFRDLRLRPALDLLAQVAGLPAGEVVDLGCGDGAVAAALAARFPGRGLVGVDSSAAMLAKAAERRVYDRLVEADIAGWTPLVPPALIFSNAALNWVPGHAALMPHLAQMLAPGGMLAVQMPRQGGAPSHRLLQKVAEQLFPGRFPPRPSPVLPAQDYAELLLPLGEVRAWTTDYVQMLDPVPQGHPVRAFTESTAMRPYLAAMSADEARAYVAAYEVALAEAYPALPDGRVLFPFTRIFFTLERP
ncbi:methyltransferase domain-containing protein [Tabrizicola aquatica]|uniref:methyltransferase domain-containing protein n=1 Tax=Tabrizicola aquatica TaxID=909926 RepID=UPI000CD10481|nr:methyltransferase domain-containing protein [Tabrizicola aquatica]